MHLLAVLPKAHRLGKKKTLEISELVDEPLLLMGPGAASQTWFEAACHVAPIKPRVLLQSMAPHTLIKLAKSAYGITIVPSPVSISRDGVRTVPLVLRGASIGRWAVVAWDPQRFLAPYAETFVHNLVASVRRTYPGHEHTRRARPLPRPKEING